MSEDEMPIGQSFELPCGLKLSNRIVKAALEESLGSGDNQPNQYIYHLYERWAKGSFGLLLTGNVQIDERYPGLITDLMSSNKDKMNIEKWKRYADFCQSHGTPTIVQINHAGRQSPIGKRPFMQRNRLSHLVQFQCLLVIIFSLKQYNISLLIHRKK